MVPLVIQCRVSSVECLQNVLSHTRLFDKIVLNELSNYTCILTPLLRPILRHARGLPPMDPMGPLMPLPHPSAMMHARGPFGLPAAPPMRGRAGALMVRAAMQVIIASAGTHL